jgi:hypothetical protein
VAWADNDIPSQRQDFAKIVKKQNASMQSRDSMKCRQTNHAATNAPQRPSEIPFPSVEGTLFSKHQRVRYEIARGCRPKVKPREPEHHAQTSSLLPSANGAT